MQTGKLAILLSGLMLGLLASPAGAKVLTNDDLVGAMVVQDPTTQNPNHAGVPRTSGLIIKAQNPFAQPLYCKVSVAASVRTTTIDNSTPGEPVWVDGPIVAAAFQKRVVIGANAAFTHAISTMNDPDVVLGSVAPGNFPTFVYDTADTAQFPYPVLKFECIPMTLQGWCDAFPTLDEDAQRSYLAIVKALGKLPTDTCNDIADAQATYYSGHQTLRLVKQPNDAGLTDLYPIASLRVKNVDLRANDFRDLAALQYAPFLASVDLSFNPLAPAVAITCPKKLTKLTIHHAWDSDAGQGMNALALSGCDGLQTLDLTFNGLTTLPQGLPSGLLALDLTDNGLAMPPDLSPLTQLTTLSLAKNPALGSGAALSSLPLSLTTLNLADTAVSDVGFATRLTNLVTIGLKNDSIRDLSPLAPLRKLRAIDVSGDAQLGLAAATCPTSPQVAMSPVLIEVCSATQPSSQSDEATP